MQVDELIPKVLNFLLARIPLGNDALISFNFDNRLS